MELGKKQRAILGIIGGMGALSHVEFERKLIQHQIKQGNCRDRDYPIWILVNGANIPDRSENILNHRDDCTSYLIQYGRLLEAAGADFLVVICNTAHAFYHQVQPHLNIPWINLIDCTIKYITQNYPTVKTIAVLATDGTIQADLYGKPLREIGLKAVYPPLESDSQRQIMLAIYQPQWGIKATGEQISGEVFNILETRIDELQQQGVELAIAGCTELGIAFGKMPNLPIPWVDPLDIIAQVSLDLAFGNQPL